MGEESVEKESMEIEEADDRKTEDNEHDKYQAHPMIWVPTSLLVALLLAVCNVISTYLSNYGLKLRELHSPSTITMKFCIVSYDYKKGNNYALKTHQNPGYFDWFFEIYYKVSTECSGDNNGQQLVEKSNSADAENQSLLQVKIIKTLRWEIILLTIFAGILSILTAWCIILAFHYAVIANMNSGVVMSAFS